MQRTVYRVNQRVCSHVDENNGGQLLSFSLLADIVRAAGRFAG